MYWILEADLRVEGLATVMDLPDSINIIDWMLGKVLPENKTPIQLTLAQGSGDFRGHILGGILPLFHEKLRDILEEFGVSNVQYFPVDLADPHTETAECGYYLVNVLGLIACVEGYDMNLHPLKRPTHLERFTVDPARVQKANIFRLAEKPRMIIISEELKSFLDNKGMVGVRMRPTTEYTVL